MQVRGTIKRNDHKAEEATRRAQGGYEVHECPACHGCPVCTNCNPCEGCGFCGEPAGTA